MSSMVYDERTVDILSALELSQSALVGSPNIKRILLARLALTMADPKQIFQNEHLNKICLLFVSIEHLIQLSDMLRSLSFESYMYWHHDTILPIYSRYVIDINESEDCEKIHVRMSGQWPIELDTRKIMCFFVSVFIRVDWRLLF